MTLQSVHHLADFRHVGGALFNRDALSGKLDEVPKPEQLYNSKAKILGHMSSGQDVIHFPGCC